MGFPKWVGATRCTGGPQPGVLAFMRWFVEEYGDEGGFNLGIYNCRSVRGGSTTSLHGEGRAADLGFPVGDPDGNELVSRLLKVPGRMGIQAIIYERRIYSAISPGGRFYDGVNPHADHLHVEFTWEASRELTYATVVDLMEPGLPRFVAGTRALHEGMRGTDVRVLQRKLNARLERELQTDGEYGPRTAAAVKRFEEKSSKDYPRLVVDDKVGAITWKALGVTPKVKAA